MIIMTAILNSGCGSPSENQEQSSDFYSDSQVGDLFRIPLLDPIELQSADEAYWFLKPAFNGINETNEAVDNIDKVGVVDSIVICFSERTYRDSEMGAAWYVIDVENKSEKCLITENDYVLFLEENAIENVELTDVHKAYTQFATDKILLKDKSK